MKKHFPYYLFLLLCMLSSCVSIYFTEPQPVDVKSRKNIPKKLRGTWIDKNDTTYVGKRTFRKVEWQVEIIAQSEVDADSNTQIKGDRIFKTDVEPLTGYSFTRRNDSLVVNTSEEVKFELNKTAELRKISRDYWALNWARDSIWQEVFLVHKLADGTIQINKIKKPELKLVEQMKQDTTLEIIIGPYDENKLTTSKYQKFWDISFTQKEMLQFIQLGGFSDTLMVLEPQFKID